MAEIINFNKAKKARSRAEKEKAGRDGAAENRAKFGASKTEKSLSEAERERRDHALDAAKRDKPEE